MAAYWVNVDKPEKRCTLHISGCRHEMEKYNTEYKGILQIKRDGGWLSFATSSDAERYCKKEFPRFNFKRCDDCGG
jgi:hypothetical protein